MIPMFRWRLAQHCRLDVYTLSAVRKILPGDFDKWAYRITWNHLHCLCYKLSPFCALSETFGRESFFFKSYQCTWDKWWNPVKTMLQWHLNSCKMLEIQQYRCILSKPCWKIRKWNRKKGSDALLTTDEKSVGVRPILSWNEEAASDRRYWKQG